MVGPPPRIAANQPSKPPLKRRASTTDATGGLAAPPERAGAVRQSPAISLRGRRRRLSV